MSRVVNLAISASILTLASARALVPRQADGSFTCDGRFLPNFDDCRTLLDRDIYPQGNNEFCLPPAGGGANCRFWAEGNCQLSSCNFGTEEFCPLHSVEGTRMDIIIQGCEASASGGRSESVQNIQVEVRDNPDFVPMPASFMASSEDLNITKMSKRQQESDTEFRIFGRGTAVQQPGQTFQVGGRLPAGATRGQVMGNEMTIGFGTEISASSSFLGLVEASVGFSFNFETTVSNSESLDIPVNCNPEQQGVIEWSPLYNFYMGAFEPSGDQLTVWEPLDTSASQGNYAVRCLG